MKTFYHYLQILIISCLLLGFKLPGNAQEQKFVLVQDQQGEDGNLYTLTTQLSPGIIEVARMTTKNTKSPIKLAAKLRYYPADSTGKMAGYTGNHITFFSKSYPSYVLDDTVSATLLVLSVTPENADEYRYRVVENDSNELVPWSPIPGFEQKYEAKAPYGYLGDFKKPGQVLMIEVVHRKNYNIRDGVVFHWTYTKKPVITNLRLSVQYVNSKGMWSTQPEWRTFNEYATQFDKVTGLPLNMKIPYNHNVNLVVYFKKQLALHYTYDIKTKIDGRDAIFSNHFDMNNGVQYIMLNGLSKFTKHELIIRRTECSTYSDQDVIKIPFEFYEPDEFRRRNLRYKLIRWSIGIFIPFTILFLIYYSYSRRKLKKTQQQKEKATLQLKAIRLQLNPHFTFNALNSIQNLMNKNDVEAANHYLTRFASLTRRVLASGDNDRISLADEITLLDDYLQMEQLRFGFTYKINVDSALNKANIEIPFMLLQPFVENAVKHGVSPLADKGLVEIDIARNAKNLILSVSDNGAGFNENILKPKSMGMGLKLSRERIALLNNMNQNQAISLHIVSNNTGSKISVMLADWLA